MKSKFLVLSLLVLVHTAYTQNLYQFITESSGGIRQSAMSGSGAGRPSDPSIALTNAAGTTYFLKENSHKNYTAAIEGNYQISTDNLHFINHNGIVLFKHPDKSLGVLSVIFGFHKLKLTPSILSEAYIPPKQGVMISNDLPFIAYLTEFSLGYSINFSTNDDQIHSVGALVKVINRSAPKEKSKYDSDLFMPLSLSHYSQWKRFSLSTSAEINTLSSLKHFHLGALKLSPTILLGNIDDKEYGLTFLLNALIQYNHYKRDGGKNKTYGKNNLALGGEFNVGEKFSLRGAIHKGSSNKGFSIGMGIGVNKIVKIDSYYQSRTIITDHPLRNWYGFGFGISLF